MLEMACRAVKDHVYEGTKEEDAERMPWDPPVPLRSTNDFILSKTGWPHWIGFYSKRKAKTREGLGEDQGVFFFRVNFHTKLHFVQCPCMFRFYQFLNKIPVLEWVCKKQFSCILARWVLWNVHVHFSWKMSTHNANGGVPLWHFSCKLRLKKKQKNLSRCASTSLQNFVPGGNFFCEFPQKMAFLTWCAFFL